MPPCWGVRCSRLGLIGVDASEFQVLESKVTESWVFEEFDHFEA